MPTWCKRSLLGLITVAIAAVGIGTYFHKTDSKFRYWWGLPLQNRLLSIGLEIQRPFIHFFSSEIDPRSYRHLTRDVLTGSVESGANWIINMQEESGRFNYRQNPENNSFSNRSEDNFLRQAGTSYALVSTFAISGDSAVLKATLRSLTYLNRYLQTPSADTAYYMFRRKAKLGGTALPMLTMLKLKELTGDTVYDQRLKALANTILLLQAKYATGQYKSTYIYNGSYTYEKDRGWESQIYPGEAMLALTEMYRTYKDEKYLKSIDQAYNYYSKDGRWRHFSFMPWATIAMSRIARITGDHKYAEFAFEMTDRILYWQNLNPDKIEYGSLFGVPTVFTSTWMEGVGEALLLARDWREAKKENVYFDRLMIALGWLNKLQYSDSEITSLSYPKSAVGGYRRSLIEPEIRIDNTQHAISAAIKALRYLDQY